MTSELFWWKINEGSGITLTDSGSTGDDMTISDGTWTTGGKIWDDILEFDGSNDYASVTPSTSHSAGTDFSISLWFKTDTLNVDQDILRSNNFAIHTWSFNNKIGCSALNAGSGGIAMANDETLSDTWYHVILRYDGSTNITEIYINGVLQTDTASGTMGTNYGTIKLGDYYDNFSGNIDDVRLYNSKLSISEINWLYNEGNGTSYSLSKKGIWSVSDGIFIQTNTNGTCYSIWNYSGYTNWLNPEINVKIRKDTNHQAGVLFRFDETDGYCIRYKDANNIEFGTFNTSTGFTQVSETTLNRAINVWTHWKIDMKDDRLIFFWSDDGFSWIQLFTETNTTISTTGTVGLITFDTAASFDNFEIGTVQDYKVMT